MTVHPKKKNHNIEIIWMVSHNWFCQLCWKWLLIKQMVSFISHCMENTHLYWI